MEDDGKVFYRFGRKSICYTMSFKKFDSLLPKHKELRKNFNKYMNKTITQDKPVPLDYIMNLPTHIAKNFDKRGIKPETYKKYLLLENQFKNVVLRRLIEIRQEKLKPTLK
jgi:hypothetical protein